MADSTKDNEQEAEDKPEQAVVAYRYLSQHNPSNAFYPGVPPGDILQEKFDTYPKWIQNSIAESPMYKAVEHKKAADKDKAPSKESEK